MKKEEALKIGYEIFSEWRKSSRSSPCARFAAHSIASVIMKAYERGEKDVAINGFTIEKVSAVMPDGEEIPLENFQIGDLSDKAMAKYWLERAKYWEAKRMLMVSQVMREDVTE